MEPFTIIGIGMQIGSSIFGAVQAAKEREEAKKKADELKIIIYFQFFFRKHFFQFLKIHL